MLSVSGESNPSWRKESFSGQRLRLPKLASLSISSSPTTAIYIALLQNCELPELRQLLVKHGRNGRPYEEVASKPLQFRKMRALSIQIGSSFPFNEIHEVFSLNDVKSLHLFGFSNTRHPESISNWRGAIPVMELKTLKIEIPPSYDVACDILRTVITSRLEKLLLTLDPARTSLGNKSRFLDRMPMGALSSLHLSNFGDDTLTNFFEKHDMPNLASLTVRLGNTLRAPSVVDNADTGSHRFQISCFQSLNSLDIGPSLKQSVVMYCLLTQKSPNLQHLIVRQEGKADYAVCVLHDILQVLTPNNFLDETSRTYGLRELQTISMHVSKNVQESDDEVRQALTQFYSLQLPAILEARAQNGCVRLKKIVMVAEGWESVLYHSV